MTATNDKWVKVPHEPTNAMLQCLMGWPSQGNVSAYRAMLAAAPQPPGNEAVPTRDQLGGMLAALRYGQYNTNDEYAALTSAIDKALANYAIGDGKFTTTHPAPDAALHARTEGESTGWEAVEGIAAGLELHASTANLVQRFARALAEKLAAAEHKYGYSDGWLSPDWMDECRQHLREHVEKGDPRDVAAYCAFLWHHDEATTPSAPLAPARITAEDVAEALGIEVRKWDNGGKYTLEGNPSYTDLQRAASALSAKSGGVVDEAMVERAYDAICRSHGSFHPDYDLHRDDVEAGLTAALTPGAKGEGT